MLSQQYQDNIKTILEKIKEADAIIVGGASGMSAANGHDFYGYSKFFRDNFSEFEKNYGIRGMFEALYYKYRTSEERWAYLAKSGTLMFNNPPGQTYLDLYKLIKDKNYFIITTNQDMQFSKVFPEEKISLPQGDAHWFQCGKPCHDKVYPAEEMLRNMVANIQDTRIPTELIPRCPVCGGEMEPWIRSFVFLQGKFWEESINKYKTFLAQNYKKKILFLELGVGPMVLCQEKVQVKFEIFNIFLHPILC